MIYGMIETEHFTFRIFAKNEKEAKKIFRQKFKKHILNRVGAFEEEHKEYLKELVDEINFLYFDTTKASCFCDWDEL